MKSNSLILKKSDDFSGQFQKMTCLFINNEKMNTTTCLNKNQEEHS